MNEHDDETKVRRGMVPWRMLCAMFLLAVAAGNGVFRLPKSTSPALVALSSVPWWLYVVVTGTMESVAVGESPFSWMSYEPAYFIWPHFVAIPVGLYAASRMVRRRRLSVPG